MCVAFFHEERLLVCSDSDEGWRQLGWRMGGPSSVIPTSVSEDVKHTDRQEENASHYITALIHCASSDDLS